MLNDDRGYGFYTSTEREHVRDIKEKLCQISKHFDAETAAEKKYEMPDGNVINVDEERYKCAECLFAPELVDEEDKGSHVQVGSCLQSVGDELDLDGKMRQNVALCGGNSMWNGVE